MTDEDRVRMLAEYVKLSVDFRDCQTFYCHDVLDSMTESQRKLMWEKEHVQRCAFFADLLENLE